MGQQGQIQPGVESRLFYIAQIAKSIRLIKAINKISHCHA
ncbi:uncharacterized protein METZ01_LOCUS437778 [marine metagenome]|uniref:Uncharacterized protein n=1 Tax=marine metagenome TaxID=408172 RepID=A0A382YNY2_9ZZZZ